MTGNNNEERPEIDYVGIQTEILLLMKERMPKAAPSEVCAIMGSLLTAVICGTADMIKDKENKYLNKSEFATSLLEAITTTVRMTIKSNYEMEKYV